MSFLQVHTPGFPHHMQLGVWIHSEHVGLFLHSCVAHERVATTNKMLRPNHRILYVYLTESGRKELL